MSEALASIRDNIEVRLTELDREAKRLRAARDALSPGQAPARPAAKTTANGRRRAAVGKRTRSARSASANGRGKAPRGARRDQFLKAVSSEPGAGAARLGELIGISSAHVQGIARPLIEEGAVNRRDHGFYLSNGRSRTAS